MRDLDALLEALRGDLERAARAAGEDERAFRAVAEELRPFVEAAAALEAGDDASAARELRSAAWLLAYRVGDQGLTALSLEALMRGWQERAGAAAPQVIERVRDLLTDGYARGREDRARSSLLRAHADAMPLVRLGSGALMLVASDPLDADGANLVAERVGAALLRAEARCVLLHLHELRDPGLDVLAALWSVASSARMLGCACVVTGASKALALGLAEGALPQEPAAILDDPTEAIHQALSRADLLVGAVPAPLRWIRRRR